MENLVRQETHRGTKRGQAHMVKIQHFSAEEDETDISNTYLNITNLEYRV